MAHLLDDIQIRHLMNEKYNKVIKLCQRSIEIGNILSIYSLGKIYWLLRNFDNAIIYFEQFLQVDGINFLKANRKYCNVSEKDIYKNLCVLYEKKDDKIKLSHYEMLLKQFQENQQNLTNC